MAMTKKQEELLRKWRELNEKVAALREEIKKVRKEHDEEVARAQYEHAVRKAK